MVKWAANRFNRYGRLLPWAIIYCSGRGNFFIGQYIFIDETNT